MKLNDYFKVFIGNISLNPGRVFDTREKLLAGDEEPGDILNGEQAAAMCL